MIIEMMKTMKAVAMMMIMTRREMKKMNMMKVVLQRRDGFQGCRRCSKPIGKDS